MPVSQGFEALVDTDNLEVAGGVLAGFVLSDHLMPGVVDRILSMAGTDVAVPAEAYGAITAFLMYGYGDVALSKKHARYIGHGGLVSVGNNLANRLNLQQTLSGAV